MQVNNLIQSSPYYDDISNAELNNYYKLLFIPGRSVQARELTQLQSLQFKQFQRLGDHFFKNGSVVIPGDISFNTKLNSITFDITSFSNVIKTNLQDQTYLKNSIIGNFLSNGTIKASISHVENINENTIKFYITYVKGNSSVNEFADEEIIDIIDSDNAPIIENLEVGEKGFATSISISDGVFYVNGLFVSVHAQSIIISDTNDPTLSVGLLVEERIITENIDSSLADPAQGISNFNAPGAHRHQINLKLVSYPIASVIENNDSYIELLKLENGFATKLVTRSTYNFLANELARRTYDESGDYTVRPWIASIEDNPADEDGETLKIAIEAGKGYIKGFEVETISKTYLNNLEKARDFAVENNRTIHTPVGNFITCFDVTEAFPTVSSHGSANIYTYAGTLMGSLRVRQIIPQGLVVDPLVSSSPKRQYRVSVFDIRLLPGFQFASAYSIGTATNKIKIKQDVFRLEGLVTASNSTTLAGNSNTRWFTSLENPLKQNDIIVVVDTQGVPHYLRVSANPSTNLSLAVVGPSGWETNVTTGCPIFLAYSAIKNTGANKLLFSLPYNRIKSIRDGNDLVDTNYVYSREVVGSISSESAILTAPIGSDEFISENVNDYVVYGNTDGIIVPSSISVTGNQATLTFPGLGNQTITVITLFRDSSAPEKNKTYTTNQSYTFAASGVNASKSVSDFWVPHADIHKINSILNQSAQNIIDDYIFDNGQNDNFYDLGRLTLKAGRPVPTEVTVNYNYFAHSTGTYFSVNSYSINLIETGKGYEYIPTYISKTDGIEWDLRDCLDFRPTINSTRTGFAHTSNIPVNFVSADFQYYLNRIDKLCVNSRGEFQIIKGIPGLTPKAPSIPSDSMPLYDIQLRAYTFGPSDVFIKYIDKKRYTMSDIGKLETRITTLEKYTTLSLLEKETEDMEILDENGLTRFKNGFIVDSFSGHNIGDVTNPEYKCSIDMNLSECRPSFKSNSVDLIQNSITNVQKTGDLITLPYTEVVFISQPIATRFMNVNPYNVFSFLGRLDLVPPLDVWKDTNTLPDLIVNQQGNYDSMVATANAFGTVWDEWETQWFGESIDVDVSRQIIGFGKNRPDRHHPTRWPLLMETSITTTTVKSGMDTRTGTQLRVIPETVLTPLGPKVVNSSYIPFMRSIDIKFVGKGLKPTTRYYAFFDDVNVSAYCSSGITFNPSALISAVPLISDATGKVEGVFRVPTSPIRFKTGRRKFTLTDSSTNSELTRTSFGSEMFEASGMLETKQNTIISTRNARLVQDVLIENRAVSEINSSTSVSTKWEDPLAQSFLVTERGGCFVSSLDLYFASKDSNIPVIVYISEMVNGYPSQTILPFSEVVIDSSAVNVTPITGTLKSEQIAATNIKFKSPVYLQENREYAFVIISNSDKYNVWIATGGENRLGTEIPVQSQPYLGTLFKSQNASTWTAQQESDIKFRLHKCKFDIETERSCSFKNKDLLPRPIDGISYLKPVASGESATKVKIDIKHHGLNSDGIIKISGASTVGDISAGELNGEHIVEFADLDYVVIEIPAVTHSAGVATGTIIAGNLSGFGAETNLPFDNLFLNVRNVTLPQTNISYGIKCTRGAHPQDTQALSSEYVLYSSHLPVMIDQTIEFLDDKKIFVSEPNMINVSGDNSFEMISLMSSSNENLSPVIDLQGMSAISVDNIVSIPDAEFTSVFDIKEIVSNTSIIMNHTSNYIETTSSSGRFLDANIGNMIEIRDSSANDGKYLIINKTDDGTDTRLYLSPSLVETETENIDIDLNIKFFDEIAPRDGSAFAKYVARRFQLAQPATSLRITFAAYWPNSFDLGVYYKILPTSSSNGIFSEEKYVKLNHVGPIVYSNNYNDYREYTFDITEIEEFSTLACKLVFNGLKTSDVPKIKDLRIIALS